MKRLTGQKLLSLSILFLIFGISLSFFMNRPAVYASYDPDDYHGKIIIIDAGHGQPDGGATSCTGVLEADLNLEISQRLQDMMRFLGLYTVMTRTTKDSIYTKGDTIAQKKVSDTRNRVDLVNNVKDGILISIHQNHFYESRYYGAQVFYKNDEESKNLSQYIQTSLTKALRQETQRKHKVASGVYLLEHIECPGILIECGFLSNSREEALLRSEDYQKKLCSIIASSCVSYLNRTA